MPARKKRPISVEISGPDKDGRYHGFLTVGTKPSGAPDRRHRSGTSYEAVEEKLRRIEADQEAGRRIPTGQPWTVARWLHHWLDNIVAVNRRSKTLGAYRPLVEHHIIPAIGGRRLSGHTDLLSAEDIDLVYARMRKAKKPNGEPYATSYIYGCHRALRRALRLAYKRGRASQDFSRLMEAPEGGKRRKVKAHDLDQTRALMAAIGRSSTPARWMVGVMLGLRQGEVLGLTWPDVHLDAKVPYLRPVLQAQRKKWQHGCDDPHACAARHCRTGPCRPSWGHGCGDTCGKGNPRGCPQRTRVHCKRHRRACPPPCPPDCAGHAKACPQKVDGGIRRVDLKSDESVRPVELPPVLVTALRTHRQQQRQQRMAAGLGRQEDGLVFCEPDGSPTDAKRDHERWEALLVDAGLPDAPLHAARHTAATMLLLTGTDVRVVQSILGHTNISVTQLYTDVAAELRRAALERMADTLFGGGVLPGGQAAPW